MSIQSFIAEYRKNEQHVIYMRHLKSKIPAFIILSVRFFKTTKYLLVNWFRSIFPLYKISGYCPCCRKKTVFIASDLWLRDSLRCIRCLSLPRDRQVYKFVDPILNKHSDLRVLEFAPLPGSYMYDRKTGSYIISHYFENEKYGKIDVGFYNEDIQNTTFSNESFDLIIHEDILEHINNPFQALCDNLRILSDNGMIVFTCPVSNDKTPTKQRVSISESGDLVYYEKPTYHGNPVDADGALVFWDYGYDFETLLRTKLPENVEIQHVTASDPRMGIVGEMIDLFCIKKLPDTSTCTSAK